MCDLHLFKATGRYFDQATSIINHAATMEIQAHTPSGPADVALVRD